MCNLVVTYAFHNVFFDVLYFCIPDLLGLNHRAQVQIRLVGWSTFGIVLGLEQGIQIMPDALQAPQSLGKLLPGASQ